MMVETTFCVIKTCNNSVHLFNMLLYAPILLISQLFCLCVDVIICMFQNKVDCLCMFYNYVYYCMKRSN